MSDWAPDHDSLTQVIQLLKESQFPCTETQRAIQQVCYTLTTIFHAYRTSQLTKVAVIRKVDDVTQKLQNRYAPLLHKGQVDSLVYYYV